MVHGDAVAYADGVDLERGAAGQPHARLDGVGDLLEVDVAGDDLVLGGDDRHERSLELLVGEPVGFEEAAVGRSRQPLLDGIASQVHGPSIPVRLRIRQCEGTAAARSMPVTGASGAA